MEEYLEKQKMLSSGSNLMTISRKVKRGELSNLGYGYYAENRKTLHFNLDETMQAIEKILDEFPMTPKHAIFSSISLNFCINQLISSTTYIVEVEKGYDQSVFEFLKNRLDNVILLNPDEGMKINYWKPNAIYIYELYTRAPTNKNGTTCIEKLIVDLLVDKKHITLFSGSDVTMSIERLCKEYAVNYQTLLSYASRRGKKKEVLTAIQDYIPSPILERITEHDQQKIA